MAERGLPAKLVEAMALADADAASTVRYAIPPFTGPPFLLAHIRAPRPSAR
jgi:hypothetical protein